MMMLKINILFKLLIYGFKLIKQTQRKIQLFEEYRANTANARLFLILIRHREIKMVSDGNKITEIKVI